MYRYPTYPVLRTQFPPNTDELILYLTFEVVNIGGIDYFRDYSSLQLHCLALTTTTQYDSIQLNTDIRVRNACTSAGCFDQFFNVDNTAKTVLLTDLSQLYLDNYMFSNVTNSIFLVYSTEQTSENLDIILDGIKSTIKKLHSYTGYIGTNKWSTGILAPNGCIYGIPYNSTTILKINTLTDEVTTFGNLVGSGKWIHAILIGNNIYGIPYSSTSILKINTLTDEITTFGDLTGSNKWSYGVLVGEIIYGIPYSSTAILKINSNTDEITLFGNLIGTSKWNDGLLASNNIIYGIPHNATTILRLNPSNDEITTFGSVSSSTFKWNHGFLMPNGIIYGTPLNYTNILKIDPLNNDEITLLGNYTSIASKWYDGEIREEYLYINPHNASNILKINSSNDELTTIGYFGIEAPSKAKYNHGITAKDIVYILSHTGTVPLEGMLNIIGIDSNDVIKKYGYLPEAFKWNQVVLSGNILYTIPFQGTYILKIELR